MDWFRSVAGLLHQSDWTLNGEKIFFFCCRGRRDDYGWPSALFHLLFDWGTCTLLFLPLCLHRRLVVLLLGWLYTSIVSPISVTRHGSDFLKKGIERNKKGEKGTSSTNSSNTHTHTQTHQNIYIYIYGRKEECGLKRKKKKYETTPK